MISTNNVPCPSIPSNMTLSKNLTLDKDALDIFHKMHVTVDDYTIKLVLLAALFSEPHYCVDALKDSIKTDPIN